MPLTRSNGRLHGPGVFDMKAGIAIAMLATRALLEIGAALDHRIVMLWTTDEEVGSEYVARGDRRRSAAQRRRAGARAVAARRRGEDRAQRMRRVSAASFAAWRPTPASSRRRAPARFRSSRARSCSSTRCRISTRGISVNVGTGRRAALRSNVIPDEARAAVDVRAPTPPPRPRSTRRCEALVAVDARTTVEVAGGFDRPPLERTRPVAASV